MTFEQLIAIVREWQSTMTPEQARGDREPFGIRNRRLAAETSIDIDTVLAVAAGRSPCRCLSC
jgi:hypothetical protein